MSEEEQLTRDMHASLPIATSSITTASTTTAGGGAGGGKGSAAIGTGFSDVHIAHMINYLRAYTIQCTFNL